MSNEPEQPPDDSPEFEPSPTFVSASDQPGMPPPAGAPAAPTPRTEPAPTSTSTQSQRSTAPVSAPAPAPRRSTASLLSSAILMIVGAAIAGGTFYLARVFAPPTPPGEVTGQPPADMVKADDLKKLSDRVDKMGSDMTTAQKQIQDRPDYSADVKTLRDRMTELDRTMTGMPAQFDSINQKLATMSKVEDASSASQVDALNKRVADLTQRLDELRSTPTSGRLPATSTAGSTTTDPKANGTALAIAIDLFKNKRWTEARDAFEKLQLAAPNDATVWYLSALANGFATNEWRGETERLVNVGLEKEKTGQTTSAMVDTQTDFLTTATGKDWLAVYRKRIVAQ